MVVVSDDDKELVIRTILESARTGTRGAYGDGKVFVLPVEASYTVSAGTKDA
jgi:nitrogen regulatory protein PII 1